MPHFIGAMLFYWLFTITPCSLVLFLLPTAETQSGCLFVCAVLSIVACCLVNFISCFRGVILMFPFVSCLKHCSDVFRCSETFISAIRMVIMFLVVYPASFVHHSVHCSQFGCKSRCNRTRQLSLRWLLCVNQFQLAAYLSNLKRECLSYDSVNNRFADMSCKRALYWYHWCCSNVFLVGCAHVGL